VNENRLRVTHGTSQAMTRRFLRVFICYWCAAGMVVYRALTLRHTIRYHCSLVLFAFSFNFVSTLCLNVCFHDQFSCRNKRGDVFVSHNLFFVLILCVSADRFYFIVFSHYPAAESACLLFFLSMDTCDKPATSVCFHVATVSAAATLHVVCSALSTVCVPCVGSDRQTAMY